MIRALCWRRHVLLTYLLLYGGTMSKATYENQHVIGAWLTVQRLSLWPSWWGIWEQQANMVLESSKGKFTSASQTWNRWGRGLGMVWSKLIHLLPNSNYSNHLLIIPKWLPWLGTKHSSKWAYGFLIQITNHSTLEAQSISYIHLEREDYYYLQFNKEVKLMLCGWTGKQL